MQYDTVTRHHVVCPAPRSVWDEVLVADSGATIYQTPAWFDMAIEVTGAADVSRLYETEDGRRLILPMLRRQLLPGFALDDSYPARLGSGGGLLASGGLRVEDVRHVLSDLLHTPAISTRIKANHDTASRWEAGLVPGVNTMPRRVEVLDLDGGFSRVWNKRFQYSARKAVRKAEGSGLVVERDTTGQLVSTFYQLYLHWTNRRAAESGMPRSVALRLARRREPLRLFESVARSLGEKCRIWLARHNGEAVASLMTLVHGDHAVSWRGYSRKELAGPLRANNLLQRLAIEDACDAGCRFYSMGESGGVAALEHFKYTLGATPREGVECRIERLPLTRIERFKGRAEAQAARLLTAGLRPRGRSK